MGRIMLNRLILAGLFLGCLFIFVSEADSKIPAREDLPIEGKTGERLKRSASPKKEKCQECKGGHQCCGDKMCLRPKKGEKQKAMKCRVGKIKNNMGCCKVVEDKPKSSKQKRKRAKKH